MAFQIAENRRHQFTSGGANKSKSLDYQKLLSFFSALLRGEHQNIKETRMPKYLLQANYVGEGVKGLLKEGGTKRRAAVEKAFKSAGATLGAGFSVFSGNDGYR